MSHLRAYPRPPKVEGVQGAGPLQAARILWWIERGYCHEVRHGDGSDKAYAAFLATMWWPMWPLLLVAQEYLVSRRRARYYLNDGALLGIVAKRDGWHVTDHVSARPGAGLGRRLRDRVLPELLQVADSARVPIHATAANARLAKTYAAHLPGLVDIGPGLPRGRKMRRDPS